MPFVPKMSKPALQNAPESALKRSEKRKEKVKQTIKLLYKITPALSTSVRGVKSANYYVIKYNSVPAVLIELGFMSNSTDLGIITNESKQQAAAKAIYDGIVESFAS